MPGLSQPDSAFQEMLFHELHHRFYNSLQIVSAAIGGLTPGHRRPEDIGQLRDRIVTLGGLHRTLAKPLVDLAGMRAAFTELCASLTRGFAHGRVTLSLETMIFPDDPMIVRGLTLILVELVTNALKYAAPGQAQIGVTVTGCRDSCRLTVTSNPGTDTAAKKRLPYVATRLAEAMGGTLTILPARNHIVCVTVPITVSLPPSTNERNHASSTPS